VIKLSSLFVSVFAVLFIMVLVSCTAEQAASTEVPTSIATDTPEPTNTIMPTDTPEPTDTPTPTVVPIPEGFKTQLRAFLQAGNAVTGATAQGVTYVEMRRLVNEARGAYDLAVAMWPEQAPIRAQTDFNNSFRGWELTLALWEMEIEKYDNPVEPDINRYRDFLSYDRNQELIIETHPDDFIVKDYREKKYVAFENIEVLMALAKDDFLQGQSQVIALLD
jgi:hypothetical protein